LLGPGLTAAGAHTSPSGVAAPNACEDCRYAGHVYFGDLHVHTSYSFDAYGFGTRLDPAGGYADTKTRLDFAAVTDHAEFLGETELCTTPGAPGYDTSQCARLRAGDQSVFAELGLLCLNDPPLIDPAVCADATAQVWERIKAAAEASYLPGSFTTFIAYEYSLEATGDSKLHRNVIFSGSNVPRPIPRSEERQPEGLWASLQANCLPANGCDVVVIPHTSSASRGKYFSVLESNGDFISPSEAATRGQMERLVEIYQNKGNAECYPGVNTTDEGCEFEKLPLIRVSTPPGGTEVLPGSWAREGLKMGIGYEELFGVNPFQYGFIGSTDNHNSIGGAVSEEGYVGNSGANDDTIMKRMSSEVAASYSPGGLAAVWATQNTRDSIFAALKRREVYATSGTRIIARFFGGWRLPTDLCSNPRLPIVAYANGVPMGSVLPARQTQRPVFVITAQQDPRARASRSSRSSRAGRSTTCSSSTSTRSSRVRDRKARIRCVRYGRIRTSIRHCTPSTTRASSRRRRRAGAHTTAPMPASTVRSAHRRVSSAAVTGLCR
jgi:hypothetical protein